MENKSFLPNDAEVAEWFDLWIAKGCSASSAIYKFRNWLREREQKAQSEQSNCTIPDISNRRAQLIMYKLQYFQSGNSLCGSDLENEQQVEHINLQQVSSLSDIKKFLLPLSGTYKGDYAVVSMQNGDIFYINKEEHSKIAVALNCA